MAFSIFPHSFAGVIFSSQSHTYYRNGSSSRAYLEKSHSISWNDTQYPKFSTSCGLLFDYLEWFFGDFPIIFISSRVRIVHYVVPLLYILVFPILRRQFVSMLKHFEYASILLYFLCDLIRTRMLQHVTLYTVNLYYSWMLPQIEPSCDWIVWYFGQ